MPYPLIDPLQVQDASDIRLHALGAGGFHLIGDVSVHVESEGGGGVTEVALNGLDVVARTDRRDGVTVPLRYNNDKPEKSRIFKGFQGFKPDF